MPDRTDYQRGYEDGVRAAADVCLRVQAEYGGKAEHLMSLGPVPIAVHEANAQATAAGLCWARIRSLPLPAPTPVEEAERAFMEAAEAYFRILHEGASLREYGWKVDAADRAYDALLAARQQEKEARDAP